MLEEKSGGFILWGPWIRHLTNKNNNSTSCPGATKLRSMLMFGAISLQTFITTFSDPHVPLILRSGCYLECICTFFSEDQITDLLRLITDFKMLVTGSST